jgi:hypothetical protein
MPPKTDKTKNKRIAKKIVRGAVAEALAGIKPESLRSWEQLWADARKIPHHPKKPPPAH